MKNYRYWVYRLSSDFSHPLTSARKRVIPCDESLQLPNFNLGLVFYEDAFWGLFIIKKKGSECLLIWLRLFQRSLNRSHFSRFGLLDEYRAILSVFHRGEKLDSNSDIIDSSVKQKMNLSYISKDVFYQLIKILKSINESNNEPLYISLQSQLKNYQLLIRTSSISTDLLFRLERNIDSLERSGQHLQRLKQALQEQSGVMEPFDSIYQSIIHNARSITASLFSHVDGWRLFNQRYVMFANAAHGNFPWELLTFGEYTMALERNFSRLHCWESNIFVGDKIVRRSHGLRFGFFDALQNEESIQEWKQMYQVFRLSGFKDINYIAIKNIEDIIDGYNRYEIVHIVAHGEIKNNSLMVIIGKNEVALESGELFMPYPVLLVAHVCAHSEQNSIINPSFPAHHVLVPDIRIKEGGQSIFLQTFYMQLLKKMSFAVAVKVARKAALFSQEDPFAFVYYGYGKQNFENFY